MTSTLDTSTAAALEALTPPAARFLESDENCATHRYLGTHRHRGLDETLALAWAERAASGISRVADITGLDLLGIPVFNTYRPLAEAGNLTVSCGKGMTREAALVSALMEAIERHSGEQHGRRGVVCPYAESKQAAPTLSPRDLVLDLSAKWDEQQPLEWMPARELRTDQVVRVPADAVFTPYATTGTRLFRAHSNGLASGNCRTEATLHALYELIERDSRAFGEGLRLGAELAPATLPDEHREIVARFERAGIGVRVFAFRSPLGLPTFFALTDDRLSQNPMLVNGGAGCHLSPTVALSRALTEAAQSRLSVISGAREDFSVRYGDQRAESYADASARAKKWASGWPTASFAEFADLSTGDLAGDLDLVLGRLAAAGLNRTLVLDLSLTGPELRVVKVIVPGIEFAANEPTRIGSRFYREAKARRNGARG